MEKTQTHNALFLAGILTSSLFCFSYSSSVQASSNALPGTQLAYFVGYHNNGVYRGDDYHYRHYPRYKAPRNYYRKVHIGATCRKTCWIDRFTGRVIRCFRTC